MITVYGFGPAFGRSEASPFVKKTETLLKLANLPYQKRTGKLLRAPKGKPVASIADILGDQPFMLGAQPSAADAAVYPFMESMVDADFDDAFNDIVKSHPNVIRYVATVHERYFAGV